MIESLLDFINKNLYASNRYAFKGQSFLYIYSKRYLNTVVSDYIFFIKQPCKNAPFKLIAKMNIGGDNSCLKNEFS